MVDTAARARPDAGGRGSGGDFDDARWRSRMQQSDIADELFLPLDHAAWAETRFRLVRGEAPSAKTRITGVRFLAADPERENLEPERAVQNDLHRLVDSLIRLRREPDWQDLCLSGETFRTSRVFSSPPRRQFGIVRGNERAADDVECARRSHAAIRRAVRSAGFVVVDPTEPFDPSTGLLGLRDWADQVRLRRRRRLWPWLFLLLLPLLLLRCEESPTFFGAPIPTRSVILLVDRSSSMQEHFDALRGEAHRLLAELAGAGGVSANIVSYCGDAESCLGEIRELDEATVARLGRFLDDLAPGGGTTLEKGIEIAADEIRRHERPTTLIVLTDAEDESIKEMVRDRAGTLARFGEVEIHSIALTPRLFGPQQTPATPRDDHERGFAELAEILGGTFGPAQETP